MQEKKLFEYAIIRLVPAVEREEFLNIGAVLYCAGQKFLDIKYTVDTEKITAFNPSVDIPEVMEHLAAFEQVCKGGAGSGAIGSLPIAERFRWLTAARSTIIQASKVHPGFCGNAKDTLDKLFEKMVG